jgi:uncharacterized membrane-anchored protein YhcB (DUF1043 family)
MTHEIFWAGAGAVCLGAVIGAWIGARLTYEFQKKLLQQQLDFQREQAQIDAKQRDEISASLFDVIHNAGQHVKHSIARLNRTPPS